MQSVAKRSAERWPQFCITNSNPKTMEKKPQIPENQDDKSRLNDEPLEKEVDIDSKIHETSPNLIQKEDHHIPIDDEVKNG